MDHKGLSGEEQDDMDHFVVRRSDKSVLTSWNDDDMNLIDTDIFGQATLRYHQDHPEQTADMPPLMRQEYDSDDSINGAEESTTAGETDSEDEEELSDDKDDNNDDDEDHDDDDQPDADASGESKNDDDDNDTSGYGNTVEEEEGSPANSSTASPQDDQTNQSGDGTEELNNEANEPGTEANEPGTEANEPGTEAGASTEAGAISEAGARGETYGDLFDEFRTGRAPQRERNPVIEQPAEVDEDNILPQETDARRPGTEKYSLRKSVEPLWKKPRTVYVQVNEQNLEEIDPVGPVKCMRNASNLWEIACTQVSATEGVKKFGERAEQALIKEWIQLDYLNVYEGIQWYQMSKDQHRGALRLVQLIKQKRCGKIKGCTCVDRRPQRAYILKDEATSPTANLESLLLSFMIDAADDRVVGVVDIPGAFLTSDTDEDTFVVVDGVMVDMLLKSNPEYEQFVHTTRNGKKIVYLKLLKQMYGTVRAARVFYDGLVAHLSLLGFESNPYDSCVMNKMVDGHQCTVIWHVDDLKVSHKKREVVDFVMRALQKKYNASELNPTIGPTHDYVGMEVHFPGDGTVHITMKSYIKSALEEFPDKLGSSVRSPCSEHLFEVGEKAPQLDKEKRKIFHTIVCRLLFISTRARPDIYLTIAFLTSRCNGTDEHDWKKLRRLLTYLRDTIDLELILCASSMTVVKWWVDAAYGVRNDFRSQTGAAMSLGRGCFQVKSVKQNLNTKSSTEAEVVAASDMAPYLLWTKYFLEAQGFDLDQCILFQDNESAIRLERNGRLSSGKSTKHINIRYFWLKDCISSGDLSVEHCGTDKMIADFYTKPLQGAKFVMFRDLIMGHVYIPDNIDDNQERVGK